MVTASIQQVLKDAEATLLASDAQSDSPKLDAELLLSQCLGESRTYLISHSDEQLSAQTLKNFHALLERRASGEPVAYIIGKREFWNIELAVNSSVLVPRPETELLIEVALNLLADTNSARVADLGTGSGAIALALAHNLAGSHVLAVDVSDEALQTAQQNAESLNLANVEFRRASWCDGLEPDSYDLIVANPPYVAPGDPHLEKGDLRFEPNIALEADEEGLADLYTIANDARKSLKTGGHLLMEHGFDQYEALVNKLSALGYSNIEGHKDLAGLTRVIQGQWQTGSKGTESEGTESK